MVSKGVGTLAAHLAALVGRVLADHGRHCWHAQAVSDSCAEVGVGQVGYAISCCSSQEGSSFQVLHNCSDGQSFPSFADGFRALQLRAADAVCLCNISCLLGQACILVLGQMQFPDQSVVPLACISETASIC